MRTWFLESVPVGSQFGNPNIDLDNPCPRSAQILFPTHHKFPNLSNLHIRLDSAAEGDTVGKLPSWHSLNMNLGARGFLSVQTSFQRFPSIKSNSSLLVTNNSFDTSSEVFAPNSRM